jgi:hypothetical protein
VTDINMAKAGGRSFGAVETVGRLLDLFWQTESDSLRRSAYIALLSYRFLQPISSELEKEIDSIEECCPEMGNALSDGAGFYLGRLVGRQTDEGPPAHRAWNLPTVKQINHSDD